MNPFSDKKRRSKPADDNPSPMASPIKQSKTNFKGNQAEDSDDDIMIVEEVVADTQPRESENGESDADEAEGDSDELDEEDSDNSSKIARNSLIKKRRRC